MHPALVISRRQCPLPQDHCRRHLPTLPLLRSLWSPHWAFYLDSQHQARPRPLPAPHSHPFSARTCSAATDTREPPCCSAPTPRSLSRAAALLGSHLASSLGSQPETPNTASLLQMALAALQLSFQSRRMR